MLGRDAVIGTWLDPGWPMKMSPAGPPGMWPAHVLGCLALTHIICHQGNLMRDWTKQPWTFTAMTPQIFQTAWHLSPKQPIRCYTGFRMHQKSNNTKPTLQYDSGCWSSFQCFRLGKGYVFSCATPYPQELPEWFAQSYHNMSDKSLV